MDTEKEPRTADFTLNYSSNGWLVPGRGSTWIIDSMHPSLQQFLHEVQRALAAELFFSAIAISLSVPDVCSALECDPGKIWTTPEKYKNWFDLHVAQSFKTLTSDDCYRLRCGVLHQGNFGHPKSRYDRVVFLAPNKSFRLSGDILVTSAPGVNFGSVQGKVLQIEALWFCQQFISAARNWAETKRQDPNVQTNLPNLVRFRPEGLSPYIVGVPLIA